MTNIILVAGGALVALLGFFAIINPNVSRIISAPGTAKIKGIIAIVIGLILIIVGLTV